MEYEFGDFKEEKSYLFGIVKSVSKKEHWYELYNIGFNTFKLNYDVFSERIDNSKLKNNDSDIRKKSLKKAVEEIIYVSNSRLK